MSRHRGMLALSTVGRRFATHLGACLALFAILLQVLMPLAPAQAAMTADGLFPAVCGLHDFAPYSQPADTSALDQRQHCSLCQVHALDRLATPERLAVAAFPVMVERAAWPRDYSAAPGLASAVPPLPSRGPPSAA